MGLYLGNDKIPSVKLGITETIEKIRTFVDASIFVEIIPVQDLKIEASIDTMSSFNANVTANLSE